MEAIFDRNILDVQTAKEYRAKIINNGFDSLSDEEKTIWFTGLKACLNYTDLNRIESNCKTLSDIFDLGLVTKTDWSINDAFNIRQSDYERIRHNVAKIRAMKYVYTTTPSVPELPLNQYSKINDIEKILYDVYTIYEANKGAASYMNDEMYINDQIGVI